MKTVPGTATCVGRFINNDLNVSAAVPSEHAAKVWAVVGAGYDFTCGITADLGELVCWGPLASAYPPTPDTVKGWGRLFVGITGVCAVPANNQTAMSCWGNPGPSYLTPDNPNNVNPNGDSWISVSIGFDFACGILKSSTVAGTINKLKCWGQFNDYGRFNVPVSATGPYPDWSAVSAGATHAC